MQIVFELPHHQLQTAAISPVARLCCGDVFKKKKFPEYMCLSPVSMPQSQASSGVALGEYRRYAP